MTRTPAWQTLPVPPTWSAPANRSGVDGAHRRPVRLRLRRFVKVLADGAPCQGTSDRPVVVATSRLSPSPTWLPNTPPAMAPMV